MRRAWLPAAIVALLVAACAREAGRVLQGSGRGSSGFPGGLVQDNDVADDRRALSANGQDFVRLQCVRNGATGRAIALFTTVELAGPRHLWATHFDGSSFTPPVELLAEDQDEASEPSVGRAIVAFLNTATFALSASPDDNARVRARDGDAVILWSRRDSTVATGDPGMEDDDRGPNVRLHYTYFDADWRASPRHAADVRGRGAETLRHGFTEMAVTLDPLDEGAGMGADGTAEDVVTFGVVSDGLHGSAVWVMDPGVLGDLRFSYEWGDAVTFLVAAWTQVDDGDDGGGDGIETGQPADAPQDRRLFTSTLDLRTARFGTTRDDGLGVSGAFGGNSGPSRGQTLVFVEILLSNDGVLASGYLDDADGPETPVGGEPLGATDVAGALSDALSSMPIQPGSVAITIDVDSSSGSQERFDDPDRDGVLAGTLGGTGTIDYDTGAIVVSGTIPGQPDNAVDYVRDVATDVVLNAITAAARPDGADLAGVELSPRHAPDSSQSSVVGGVFVVGADAGLDATYVLYGHSGDSGGLAKDDEVDVFVSRLRESASPFSQTSDLAQLSMDTPRSAGGADVAGESIRVAVDAEGRYVAVAWRQPLPTAVDAENDVGLLAAIVRDGADAFARGVRGGLIHEPQVLSIHQGGGVLDGVIDARFQEDDADDSWLPALPRQSDPDRINIIFLQEENSGDPSDDDEIHLAQLVLGADETAPVAPRPAVPVETRFGDGAFLGPPGSDLRTLGAMALDAGAGGKALVIFRRDTDLASPDGVRLFAVEVDGASGAVAGPVVVGSSRNDRDAVDHETAVTPRSPPLSRSRPLGVRRVHLLLREERSDAPLDSRALVHRAYDATLAVAGVPFEARFLPPLSEQPFQVDRRTHVDATLVGHGTAGDCLGAYFLQSGHAHYNEFDGASWIVEAGAVTPRLVDDESGTDPELVAVSQAVSSSDPLQGGIVFFAKRDADGDLRLRARRRN